MDDFLQGMGIAFLCVIGTAIFVAIVWWVEGRWAKASEFEDWKEGVSNTLTRMESSCNYLESQARKGEKAKAGARRK